ncbi:hypothetical protein CR513_51358, partial [Mucuna pruriens]
MTPTTRTKARANNSPQALGTPGPNVQNNPLLAHRGMAINATSHGTRRRSRAPIDGKTKPEAIQGRCHDNRTQLHGTCREKKTREENPEHTNLYH